MEIWEILDKHGNKIGKTNVRGTPLKYGQYHLVVHIWVTDEKGRLLIQKRSVYTEHMPGEWAATGGSALAGESSEKAAMRELEEELGIITNAGEMHRIGNLRRTHSLVDIWVLRRNIDLEKVVLQEEEVDRVALVTKHEFMNMLNNKTFHDYGKRYFRLIFNYIYGEQK